MSLRSTWSTDELGQAELHRETVLKNNKQTSFGSRGVGMDGRGCLCSVPWRPQVWGFGSQGKGAASTEQRGAKPGSKRQARLGTSDF